MCMHCTPAAGPSLQNPKKFKLASFRQQKTLHVLNQQTMDTIASNVLLDPLHHGLSTGLKAFLHRILGFSGC